MSFGIFFIVSNPIEEVVGVAGVRLHAFVCAEGFGCCIEVLLGFRIIFFLEGGCADGVHLAATGHLAVLRIDQTAYRLNFGIEFEGFVKTLVSGEEGFRETGDVLGIFLNTFVVTVIDSQIDVTAVQPSGGIVLIGGDGHAFFNFLLRTCDVVVLEQQPNVVHVLCIQTDGKDADKCC